MGAAALTPGTQDRLLGRMLERQAALASDVKMLREFRHSAGNSLQALPDLEHRIDKLESWKDTEDGRRSGLVALISMIGSLLAIALAVVALFRPFMSP